MSEKKRALEIGDGGFEDDEAPKAKKHELNAQESKSVAAVMKSESSYVKTNFTDDDIDKAIAQLTKVLFAAVKKEHHHATKKGHATVTFGLRSRMFGLCMFRGQGTVSSTTKSREVRMFVGHEAVDDWLDCGYPPGKNDSPTFSLFGSKGIGFYVDPRCYSACKFEEVKVILNDYSLVLKTKTSLLSHV